MDMNTAMDCMFYVLVAISVGIAVVSAMALVVMAIEVADEFKRDRRA